MTLAEKYELIYRYEYDADQADRQFELLRELSSDSESMIRAWAACQLVDYVNEEAKDILLHLTYDTDWLTRTEAYDSLSEFPFDDVKRRLLYAITHERSGVARSYAIMSWADVLRELDDFSREYILFLKKRRKLEKSYHCKLACCYGLYILGDESSLKRIFAFLSSRNYQLRCGAINLLRPVISEDNKEFIMEALVQVLAKEQLLSVRDDAEKLLKELRKNS